MIVLGIIQTFAYRVGESTAHNIIKETYTMLVQVLMPIYMKAPSEDEWKCSKDFLAE